MTKKKSGEKAQSKDNGLTPVTFAEQVLAGLGAPLTNANINALVGWEAQEGGNWKNDARFNPLNTTLKEPGSSDVGTQGNIASYTSWAEGVKATVATLKNGRYQTIVSDFRNNAGESAIDAAVDASPWGTKGLHPSATTVSAPVVAAPAKVTAAGKTAAKALYNAGLRGDALVTALASLASFTNGKYTSSTLASFVHTYKTAQPLSPGADNIVNGKYLPYIGQAEADLKAAGHPSKYTGATYTAMTSGDEGAAVPQGITGGAATGAYHAATGALTDIDSLIKWIGNPANLMRVGFILLGGIVILIGLAKLGGASASTPITIAKAAA